jgi:signal transduction histidine kinase/ActR/RegA family two-component response regulator
MSGWGWVNFLHDRNSLSLELRQQTEVTANRLGQALVNPVWNLDDDEIGRIIQYEAQSDKILAVTLRSNDGRLLAGCIKSGGAVAVLPANTREKELAGQHGSDFVARAKVSKGLEHLAAVTVYADDNPLRTNLRQRLSLSAIGIFLLCLGLTAALFLALRRTIVRPLRELEESVDQISIDNLAIPIPISGSDEIGRLADRFREMTAELQSSLDQQRQKEEQLLQAQKMEAVGMLVGGISHDFNNILCAISGSAELLTLYLQAEQLVEKEKITKHLSIINDAGNRAAALIRQLLTLSMKQEVLLTAVDLRDTVRHVVKLLQSSLDKSINLLIDLPETPAMVNADQVQMEQLLLNLCINASHAMTIMKPESDAWGGDLHISLKLMDCADSHLRTECSEASQNSSWLLSVADTGVGMDSSVKEHIFTPFFTTKKKGVGSGLGLSMAYSIIKQHCGDLMVHSEPGQGSTFHILLPALHQQNNDYQRAGNLNNSTLPAGTGSILVVDDDIAIRENVFQILTQCGYTVILADNGVEGIRLAKLLGADIRLVLLDMIMPVLSGMDALPQIKVSVPHAKILLTSGFKQDPRVLSLLAKGAVDDFIQKPYQLNQLAWQIQALLTISEQQDCTIIGKT